MFDAKELLEHEQRGDDPDDRGRIGDRIRQCRQREPIGRDPGNRAEGLRSGAERRRVRRGAGKDAEHRRAIELPDPSRERRGDRAEEDDRCRERIQLHPLLPQRREETRPELQTDREDEQDQPKLLHEIERVMIHRLAEMPDENPREQHARRAEPDAAKLQAPERHAEHANAREHGDRMRDRLRLVEMSKPVHLSCYPISAAFFTSALAPVEAGAMTHGAVRRCSAYVLYVLGPLGVVTMCLLIRCGDEKSIRLSCILRTEIRPSEP